MSYRRCSSCGDAFYPDRSYHRLCWECWRRSAPGRRRPAPSSAPALDAATLRDAVALTHPDRHPPERREAATRITAALLAARERV